MKKRPICTTTNQTNKPYSFLTFTVTFLDTFYHPTLLPIITKPLLRTTILPAQLSTRNLTTVQHALVPLFTLNPHFRAKSKRITFTL